MAEFSLYIYYNCCNALSFGVEYGVHSPAGSAVIAGQEQGGIIHHVLIAPLHTVRGIAVLKDSDLITAIQKPVIAPALCRAPTLRLAAAGDGGLKADIRVLFPKRNDRFSEIHIAAQSHSADKMPKSRLIYALKP